MDQRWNELQENPMGEQAVRSPPFLSISNPTHTHLKPRQDPELPGLGQHYCIHCEYEEACTDCHSPS